MLIHLYKSMRFIIFIKYPAYLLQLYFYTAFIRSTTSTKHSWAHLVSSNFAYVVANDRKFWYELNLLYHLIAVFLCVFRKNSYISKEYSLPLIKFYGAKWKGRKNLFLKIQGEWQENIRELQNTQKTPFQYQNNHHKFRGYQG